MELTCSVPTCGRPARSRGWCSLHYERWLDRGSLETPERKLPLSARFLAKVEKHDVDCECCNGCWHWRASLLASGYGTVHAFGATRRAHRVAYELFVGPIPDGLHLDHLCRNKGCVNPDHREPVTSRENTLRGDTIAAANAAKTHCADGHPFDARNTRIRKDRPGNRECVACERERGLLRRAA